MATNESPQSMERIWCSKCHKHILPTLQYFAKAVISSIHPVTAVGLHQKCLLILYNFCIGCDRNHAKNHSVYLQHTNKLFPNVWVATNNILMPDIPNKFLTCISLSFYKHYDIEDISVFHLEKQSFQKVTPFCSSVSTVTGIFTEFPWSYFIFLHYCTCSELFAIFLAFKQPW